MYLDKKSYIQEQNMVKEVFESLSKKIVGKQVFTIKENYELGNNLNAKVLAFAFGLSAEIERNLISARTKEALARKRAEGVKLGRPKGCISKALKLSGKENRIKELLERGTPLIKIAKLLKVHRSTLVRFMRNM